ncbi:hypothetical protein A1OS_12690 [Enterovibrio norvegicus]|uniref:hypothetical protein n=1 Tax=Enterovibrio norvegicus TaxID=188144 RepID=UPI0002ED19DC|nr:hypothetical protein [Enterovibrio norvegicus]OEE68513.1 hypothetical protein A1OS_12690 [Enterovibrio norvegicus]
MSNRSNIDNIVFSIVAAISFSFLAQFVLATFFASDVKDNHTLNVTATGSSNEKSLGTEVWLYNIQGDNWRVEKNEGWEERNGVWLSYQNQPSSLLISSDTIPTLTFAKHPHSGEVEIKTGDSDDYISIDLYSENQQFKVFNSRDYLVDFLSHKSFFIFLLFFLVIKFIGCFFPKRNVEFFLITFLSVSVFFILVFAFYPGVYTNDSADQLSQAISLNFSDWHPPLMSMLWAELNTLFSGYSSLFIFIIFLLSAGLYLISLSLFLLERSKIALVIPLVLLSPYVVNFVGVVWKDVLYAALSLLSLGSLFLAIVLKSGKKMTVILGGAAIIISAFAFGVRTNGLFMMLTVVFMVFNSLRDKNANKSKIALNTIVVSIMSVLCIWLISASGNPDKRYPIQYLQVFDLVGISVFEQRELFPEYLLNSTGYDFDEIASQYNTSLKTTGNANGIVFLRENDSPSLLTLTVDENELDELRKYWIITILENPISYMKHRFQLIEFFLNSGFYSLQYPNTDKERHDLFSKFNIEVNSDIHETEKRTVLQRALLSNSIFLYDHDLMKGLYIIVFCLTIFFITVPFYRRNLVLKLVCLLTLSSIMYFVPYLIVLPASDFRYLYWPCLATTLSALILSFVLINKVTEKFTSIFNDFIGGSYEK